MTVQRIHDPLASYLDDMFHADDEQSLLADRPLRDSADTVSEPLDNDLDESSQDSLDAQASFAPNTEPATEMEAEVGLEAEPEPQAQLEQLNANWVGFGVAHLILSLPGEAIAGILPDCENADLEDNGSLKQGRLLLGEENYLLVDAAKMVLPEAHFQNLPPLSARAAGIVVLRDTGLALVADSVPRGVEIEHDEVRWRQGSGSRRWMAGTIMNRNMVVLDVAGTLEAITVGEGS